MFLKKYWVKNDLIGDLWDIDKLKWRKNIEKFWKYFVIWSNLIYFKCYVIVSYMILLDVFF